MADGEGTGAEADRLGPLATRALNLLRPLGNRHDDVDFVAAAGALRQINSFDFDDLAVRKTNASDAVVVRLDFYVRLDDGSELEKVVLVDRLRARARRQ